MFWSVGGKWGGENNNIQDADWRSGGDFGQCPLVWVQVSGAWVNRNRAVSISEFVHVRWFHHLIEGFLVSE